MLLNWDSGTRLVQFWRSDLETPGPNQGRSFWSLGLSSSWSNNRGNGIWWQRLPSKVWCFSFPASAPPPPLFNSGSTAATMPGMKKNVSQQVKTARSCWCKKNSAMVDSEQGHSNRCWGDAKKTRKVRSEEGGNAVVPSILICRRSAIWRADWWCMMTWAPITFSFFNNKAHCSTVMMFRNLQKRMDSSWQNCLFIMSWVQRVFMPHPKR